MKETEFERLLSRLHDAHRQIEELPKSRSLSLALTKLDEAKFWLKDAKRENPALLDD